MEKKKIMKMQKSASIGSPRPRDIHQKILLKLSGAIMDLVDIQHYDVLAEATITDNLVSEVAPDVLIRTKDKRHVPILIIEITNRRDQSRVRHKIRDRILSRFPNIEAFMYNYETMKWESNFPSDIENRSYSQLLDVDLNEIVANIDLNDCDEKVTLATYPIRRTVTIQNNGN